MLIWLHANSKPSRSILEREMQIMDQDNSKTLDRIEWVSYLCAPSAGSSQLGNMDYYDFYLRELYDKIDVDNDGTIQLDELCEFLEKDFG